MSPGCISPSASGSNRMSQRFRQGLDGQRPVLAAEPALSEARRVSEAALSGSFQPLPDLLVERAPRLLDEEREDALEPLVVGRVQVDEEARRRDGREQQRLDVAAHRADDLENDVLAGGQLVGVVHRETTLPPCHFHVVARTFRSAPSRGAEGRTGLRRFA